MIQINLLKVQVRENLYKSLRERFSAGADKIGERLETQVELFQDVYQFYTYLQSQALDTFVQLNDRFEYETLWRYPTGQKLNEIVRENERFDSNLIHCRLKNLVLPGK